MPYTTNLKIQLLNNGDTNWGTLTNNNFQWAFENSIIGYVTVTMTDVPNYDWYTGYTDSNSSQAQRNLVVNVQGTLSANRNFVVPTIQKQYVFWNNTAYTITIKTLAQVGGVAIPAGKRAQVYVNGTDVIAMANYFLGDVVGNVTGNADTVTNGVYTTGNQTINGIKTFTDGVVVQANAQTTPVAVTYGLTTTIDCQLSNVFTTTLTGNITTLTINNPQDGQTILWFITQDSVGGRTITWPASFKWPTGFSNTPSSTNNAVDLLVATYRSSLGQWFATLNKAFV